MRASFFCGEREREEEAFFDLGGSFPSPSLATLGGENGKLKEEEEEEEGCA